MKVSEIVLIAGISSLVACGGGGGSESPPQANTPPPVVSSGGSGDILAPGGFNFATARLVNFEIQADAFDNKRGYVSIYSEFQTNHQGEQLPVYDTKLTMIALDNAIAAEQVMITNDIHQVYVRVNGVSSGDAPLSAVVNIENNVVSWQF